MRTAALQRNGAVLIPRVERVTRLRERMQGLLGKDGLPSGEALWICPCSSIHTFFMRFSLDLLFLSRDCEIVRIVRDVPPGRMVHGGRRAHSVLELQAGWLRTSAAAVGERVEWV